MRYIGAHINGGFERAIKLTTKLNINSVQVMPTAPMRWSLKEIPEEKGSFIFDEEYGLQDSPLKKVLVHGIYLINLARKDKQKFHLSKMSLLTYLKFLQKVVDKIDKRNLDFEILGVCFHPGSAIDLSEEEGLKRIGYGLNWVFEKAGDDNKIKILLENTAGAGNLMGDTFEELAKMREEVDEKYREKVGYVLDTQHMWASGYDLSKPEDLSSSIVDNLGWENVVAVHLNDSKTGLGSNKDRHADLGEGKIGVENLSKFINDGNIKSNRIPVILETPSLKSEEGIKQEYNKLNKLVVG